MNTQENILTDSHLRKHTYLRISITERCNLRCTYCMPAQGIPLSPKAHIMTADEIYGIAKTFVDEGVTKIRLTGGEPLVRKDFSTILEKLATLKTTLCITTNGILVDRYIDHFKKAKLQTINISLDSLEVEKNKEITRRDYFQRVYDNILLLIAEGFKVKVNCVLIKGVNDHEVIPFIELTKSLPIQVRFIEFMPFDGNTWKIDKLVSLEDILTNVYTSYKPDEITRIPDAKNDTAKNYKIKEYAGSFAIISSVSNPFCDTCNRIRLTANGQLKNCLFSTTETDLLTTYRNKEDIKPIIQKVVLSKKKIRNGLDTPEKFNKVETHSHNRSMIAIGG